MESFCITAQHETDIIGRRKRAIAFKCRLQVSYFCQLRGLSTSQKSHVFLTEYHQLVRKHPKHSAGEDISNSNYHHQTCQVRLLSVRWRICIPREHSRVLSLKTAALVHSSRKDLIYIILDHSVCNREARPRILTHAMDKMVHAFISSRPILTLNQFYNSFKELQIKSLTIIIGFICVHYYTAEFLRQASLFGLGSQRHK